MSGIKSERLENGVEQLTLASGSGNPLTPEVLDQLNARLAELTEEPPKALVLDGGDSKIFSGGFDLTVIADWDRAALGAFFDNFLSVLDKLILLPCPTIAAIGGHAIAGGFILSLGCDLRVVKSGSVKLGLSEVDLGVAVPAGTQMLFQIRTSAHAAFRLGLFGKLFESEEAVQIGYAIEAVDDPNAHAMELAATLASKPGVGVVSTKMLNARPIAAAIKEADRVGLEEFLDSWFSEVGQAYIKGLAKKLRGG